MADACCVTCPLYFWTSRRGSGNGRGVGASDPSKRGQMTHSADDDRSDLMVLHTGRLKIFRLHPTGPSSSSGAGTDDFTGETSVLSGRRSDDHAIAAGRIVGSACSVTMISRPDQASTPRSVCGCWRR